MAKRASLADMQPQAKNDAYTVMLSISLAAMVLACVLLWQDLKKYPSLKPGQQHITVTPKSLGGGAPKQGDETDLGTPKDEPTPPAGGGDAKPPAGGGEANPPAGGGETKPPGQE